jgi:DNA-binding LacI/PurR family transcriptional regulator
MTRLLTARPAIDAVFAANDPAAIGAMKAIWESGRRIPDEIAVIGAGDIAMGDLLRVPLSTVSWSRQEVGRHTAELLLVRFDEDADDPPHRIVVQPQLVVRESTTGPPRNGTAQPGRGR